jgi:hypothetical protein
LNCVVNPGEEQQGVGQIQFSGLFA